MQTNYNFRGVSEKLSIKINHHQTLATGVAGYGLVFLPLSRAVCVILLTLDFHCTNEKRITCQIYAMLALSNLSNCDSRVSNSNVLIHREHVFHWTPELHTKKYSALRKFFYEEIAGIFLFIPFMFLLNQLLT